MKLSQKLAKELSIDIDQDALIKHQINQYRLHKRQEKNKGANYEYHQPHNPSNTDMVRV